MSRAYRVLEGGGTPGPLGLPRAGRVHGQRVGPVAWSTPPSTPWSTSPAPLSCGRQRTLAARPACRGSSPARALPQARAARQKPDASATTSTLTGPLSALYQGARLSFAKTPSERDDFDFRPPVRRKSPSHDHRAAPLTPPLPLPLGRPPLVGPREHSLAPATGCVQAGSEPTEATADRSPVRGGRHPGERRHHGGRHHRRRAPSPSCGRRVSRSGRWVTSGLV